MTSLSSIENDLAFARQMAELNAMLAAVTAACQKAEAEAISLRDQLAGAEARANENWRLYLASQDEWAAERKAREEAVIQLGIERSTSERRKVRMAQVVAAEQRADAERKAREVDYNAAALLATQIWERCYKKDAPLFGILPDTLGVLTQISNMTSGLQRAETARSDALEEAAKVCDELSVQENDPYDVEGVAINETVRRCAAAIRALKEVK